MNDSEVLKELFKRSARVALQETGDSYSVLLVSEGDVSVLVEQLPADAVVLRLDNNLLAINYFGGTKEENKVSDYIIVSEAKKRILYIEMTKNKESWSDIVQQFRGTKCLLHYWKEVGKRFWKAPDFLADYEERFVSFGQILLLKRMIIEHPKGGNDSPEKALKISYPNRRIFYEHLV